MIKKVLSLQSASLLWYNDAATNIYSVTTSKGSKRKEKKRKEKKKNIYIYIYRQTDRHTHTLTQCFEPSIHLN